MNRPQSIRIRGRSYPVKDGWSIGKCDYWILQRLSRQSIERYLAFDRHAGSEGSLCVIHVLPKSRRATQQLAVLRRISQTNRNLPKLLRHQAAQESIRVVTEWIPGDDLAEYLDQARSGRKPWPSPVEALQLYRGLAHGLKQLHRACGVIHGDVKPANLIVNPSPRQLVLVDYGSAWPIERTASREAGDGHSPGYAAPELITANDVADFRSDQFSATVVLYEMLTGELPYGGQGGDAALGPQRAKLEAAYLPPSRIAREQRFVPRALWQQMDAVIARALALDANRRFASDSDWLSALKQLDVAMHVPYQEESRFEQGVLSVLDWAERVWPWKSPHSDSQNR